MKQATTGNGLGVLVLAGALAVFGDVLAQGCQPDIARYTPAERFENTADGAIMDKQTGLMWKTCSEGQTWRRDGCQGDAGVYSWQEALLRAEAVNRGGGYAGHSDWRVPNIKELDSLVELACFEPAINVEVFPDTPPGYFWAASPYLSDSEFAWGIGFRHGDSLIGRKTRAYHVRLVRGGY
ncbi:MAG TPA: DUF1566 domain-containing protein [Sedimenticola sp.]|nr:DUF1566 domain-containing protein [Sedimenticola sp.]